MVMGAALQEFLPKGSTSDLSEPPSVRTRRPTKPIRDGRKEQWRQVGQAGRRPPLITPPPVCSPPLRVNTSGHEFRNPSPCETLFVTTRAHRAGESSRCCAAKALRTQELRSRRRAAGEWPKGWPRISLDVPAEHSSDTRARATC